MPMHKTIKPGTIIFKYYEIKKRYSYAFRSTGYELVVHNVFCKTRRARTHGVSIPLKFRKMIEDLGIKTTLTYDRQHFIAIGCDEIYKSFVFNRDELYSKDFFSKLEDVEYRLVRDGNNRYAAIDIQKNEEFEEYLSKKSSNNLNKVFLFNPLSKLFGETSFLSEKIVYENEIWTE